MVQHESRQGNRCYNQFNSGGDGPGNLERPNFGAPDGWGIAQLDKPLGVSASTTEFYEWKKNVDKFFLELDEKEAVTNRSANLPTSYTITGTNTSYSAKQLSTMILYNGGKRHTIVPLSTGQLTLIHGNSIQTETQMDLPRQHL